MILTILKEIKMKQRRKAFIVAILLAQMVIGGQSAISPDSGGDGKTLTTTTTTTNVLRFEPFRRTEQYRCGKFMENNQIDAATRLLHDTNNMLIKKLSKPFPHEKLLDSEALMGRLESWRESFISKRNLWIDFELNWFIVCGFLLLFPTLFVLFYLLYSCCVCCCSRSDENEKYNKYSRYEGCRRVFLTATISVFIIVNVFCATIFFHNLYYAKSELDELPTQLHLCANDFSIYRSETNDRIRKLLRDDFFALNATLYKDYDMIGDFVVASLKRSTGAGIIDEIIDKTNSADSVRRLFRELSDEVPRIQSDVDLLQKRIANNKRLQIARSDLQKCEQAAQAGERASVCYAIRQALQSLIQSGVELPSEQQRIEQVALMLPDQLLVELNKMFQLDVESRFSPAVDAIALLRNEIQNKADQRRGDAADRLRMLDNTLFRLYEDISMTIKGVDLRFLDEQFVDPMMHYRDLYKTYIHYGFLGALIFGGIIGFIAGLFLLGLFFGCCGRRPNDYDNYDCCVYSTGSKLFSFGSWLCLLLLPFFGILTATLLFVGGNASWLVCDPMREPLARPDMIGLLDRFAELHLNNGGGGAQREKQQQSRSLRQPPTPGPFPSSPALSIYDVITPERKPADLVKGCVQGQTLYTMFGLNRKFKLTGDGGPMDEYQGLIGSIRDSLVGQIANFRNVPRDIHLYDREVRKTLDALLKIDLPRVNNSAVDRFCALRLMFQVDQALADLRLYNGTAQRKGPIPELDAVMQQIEGFQLEAQRLHRRIDDTCGRLTKLARDVDSLRLNGSAVNAQMEHAGQQLTAESLNARLREAATTVVGEMGGKILQYSQHINHSMSSEVSSCTPIADIARNTRAAVCDYTLDRLNMVWTSITLSLLLYIPLILLTRCLKPLYNKSYTYLAYTVNPRDSAFATDIYESGRNLGGGSGGGGGYGSGANDIYMQHALKISHPLQSTALTSPYATPGVLSGVGGGYGGVGMGNYGGGHSNYNYDLYPPPYMTNRHY